MKNIVIIIILCISTISCEESNSVMCLNSVVAAYPDAEIKRMPRSLYRFIVRPPDGSLIYVETMNTWDSDISSSVQLMRSTWPAGTKTVDTVEDED